MEVWFQADILSGKAGSQEETLRADGDSSPERGKGCEGRSEGRETERERIWYLTVTEQDPMWPSWDRLPSSYPLL